jgi:hypothetical protein
MLEHHAREPYVVPLPHDLWIDGGAPLPNLLHSEHTTILVFYLLRRDPTDPPIGSLRFRNCWGVLVPGYDEESIFLHPLYDRGLSDAGRIGEVINSAWRKSLEPPEGQRWPFGGNDGTLRHFVIKFHDSMFECVASGFEYESHAGPMSELLRDLSQELLDL